MVVLGRIVAPYGVLGWVKVHPLGDDPEAWRSMREWWLGSDSGGTAWQVFKLEGFRRHGASWIAKLGGVDDRGGAERLDGQYVAAPRENLPQTRENEYYWTDLIGLAVTNGQGESLGKVDSLLETGAHQVLVVKAGDGSEAMERLLPFVDHVIRDVDLTGRCIYVEWGKDW